MLFPIQTLMDEDLCRTWLLSHLHPAGLTCPHCAFPLPDDIKPSAWTLHRTPSFYCPGCLKRYNMFSKTVFEKTRYSCSTLVLLIRGIFQGVPTCRLATELDIDRFHLSDKRHQIQALLEERFSPLRPFPSASSTPHAVSSRATHARRASPPVAPDFSGSPVPRNQEHRTGEGVAPGAATTGRKMERGSG